MGEKLVHRWSRLSTKLLFIDLGERRDVVGLASRLGFSLTSSNMARSRPEKSWKSGMANSPVMERVTSSPCSAQQINEAIKVDRFAEACSSSRRPYSSLRRGSARSKPASCNTDSRFWESVGCYLPYRGLEIDVFHGFPWFDSQKNAKMGGDRRATACHMDWKELANRGACKLSRSNGPCTVDGVQGPSAGRLDYHRVRRQSSACAMPQRRGRRWHWGDGPRGSHVPYPRRSVECECSPFDRRFRT